MLRVSDYSFRKRKEGEPKHEGCEHSLEGLERVWSYDPEESASFVKECFDWTYNKDRAMNMYLGFETAMENLRDDVLECTL